MKILITGSTGFVGSWAGCYLAQKGYEVIGVDRIIPKKETEYRTICWDLAGDTWNQLLKQVRPDTIIHCAGLASVPQSVEQPEMDYEINTTMVHRMLFAMKQLSMEEVKVIFLSSAAVYGQPITLPVNEDAPRNPLSPYALHKQMAEDICLYFIQNYKFHIEILRIFSTYGPGLKKQIFWDMYWNFKKTNKLQMWGDGSESRDYIYIEDLVRVIELIMNQSNKCGHIWNVANGEEIRIRDIASLFLEKMGCSEKVLIFNQESREGDPKNWKADISKLRELGYKQTIPIDVGVQNYIEWISHLYEERV